MKKYLVRSIKLKIKLDTDKAKLLLNSVKFNAGYKKLLLDKILWGNKIQIFLIN